MFQVVLICTGNRNRSPLAEAILKKETEGLPVQVSSVGLLDLGGAPPLPETLDVAPRFDLDITAHRSRWIKSVDLSNVDLILGLEWEHVAAAVVDEGADPERSFTLLELVELLGDVPVPDEKHPLARARTMIAGAHRRRGMRRGSVGQPVRDPFGGPVSGYMQMAEIVRDASCRLVNRLFGPVSERRAETAQQERAPGGAPFS